MATVEANGPAYEFVWNELLYYERGSDIRAASHARAEALGYCLSKTCASLMRFSWTLIAVNTGELMRPRGSSFFGVRRLTKKLN